MEKKLDGNYTRMVCTILTYPGSKALQNSSYMATCLPSHKLSKQEEQDMRGTAGKAKTNSSAKFFYEAPHIETTRNDWGCLRSVMVKALGC